jgi:hypothetical protein
MSATMYGEMQTDDKTALTGAEVFAAVAARAATETEKTTHG